MQFIDECVIDVRAGNGGNGVARFRRDPNVPRGGPSGGDGGNGGSVILVADEQLSTLLARRCQKSCKAQHGEPGPARDTYGRAGNATIVRVPVGTVVSQVDPGDPDDEGELLVDLSEP